MVGNIACKISVKTTPGDMILAVINSIMGDRDFLLDDMLPHVVAPVVCYQSTCT